LQQRIVSRWFAELDDINSELRCSLVELRARSRQLVRDSGEAAGLLLDFEADIVGAAGARLQFRARRPRGTPLDPLNDRVELGWGLWGHRETCTVTGDLSMAALQRLMVRTVIQDGEFLAVIERDPRRPFGMTLRVLDADQLDESMNRPSGPGMNSIVMGVEVDGNGRPVAYHLWDRHPTSAGRTRITVLAADVVHVFKRVRPGQRRGYVVQLATLDVNLGLFGARGALGLGVLYQLAFALIVIWVRVQPIIVALSGFLALTGINLVILPRPGGMAPEFMSSWGLGTTIFSPVLLILVIATGGWLLFTLTPFYANLRMMGYDERAAWTSGVRINIVRIGAHVIAGLFAGLAALCYTALIASGDPSQGTNLTLTAVTALVLGGVGWIIYRAVQECGGKC
jgi:hypothetical protein